MILEGILTSTPEFLTCFLVSMEGVVWLGGGGRLLSCSTAQNFAEPCSPCFQVLIRFPRRGGRCESLVTSAVSKKKNWKTDGERQNHSADASAHLVLGSLAPWLAGWLGGLGAVLCRYVDTVGAVEYAVR